MLRYNAVNHKKLTTIISNCCVYRSIQKAMSMLCENYLQNTVCLRVHAIYKLKNKIISSLSKRTETI